MPKSIDQLAAEVRHCCEMISAADELTVAAAKRLDRLQRTFGEFRREMRSVSASLQHRIEDLELGRNVRRK